MHLDLASEPTGGAAIVDAGREAGAIAYNGATLNDEATGEAVVLNGRRIASGIAAEGAVGERGEAVIVNRRALGTEPGADVAGKEAVDGDQPSGARDIDGGATGPAADRVVVRDGAIPKGEICVVQHATAIL